MNPQSASPQSPYRLDIRRVTSLDDAPKLAEIFDQALRQDSFYEFVLRFSSTTPYQGALKAAISAIEDKDRSQVFKAVAVVQDKDGYTLEEKIVGYIQWFVGHIEIIEDPKVSQRESTHGLDSGPVLDAAPPMNSVVAPRMPDTGFREERSDECPSSTFDETSERLRRAYIANVGDKKHIYLRRVAVLPNFQRQGIASKLLQMAVDRADKENLVSWLNASRAGYQLYKRAGWEDVSVTRISVPGLEVAPLISMLRKPQETKAEPVE